MTHNIKTYNDLGQEGLDLLKRQGYLLNADEDYDGIMLRSQSLHEMEFPENLAAIARAGAGVDNIPLDRCSEEGIAVFNAPGANANSVKELMTAMLVNLSRNVFPNLDWTRSLTSDEAKAQWESGKKDYRGHEILGKTLGVIGLGNVGHLVANEGVHMGMRVLGYDPYMSMESAWSVDERVQRVDNLQELFTESDYISIHTPFTDETEGMIGEANLKYIKDGVYLFNYARGEVVNPTEVKPYLQNGRVRAFATDFYYEELAGMDNVFMTSHIGGSTAEAEANCSTMAAQELIDYLDNGNITNSVNLPDVKANFAAPVRLSIVNRNIPKMVAQITGHLADEGINIAQVINKAQGDYAYTLIDCDTEADVKTIVGKVREVDGILRVRVLKKK